MAAAPYASAEYAQVFPKNPEGLPRSPAWRRRCEFWTTKHPVFDAVIIGGGVQGACLYHQLVAEGRRVLLVDRGDFAGGTSQASAMLVWGGLLYLKNFDIAEVVRLCAARDRLIQHNGQQVEPQHLAFLFGRRPKRRPWVVHAGLRLYWLLALGRRRWPSRFGDVPERDFLRDGSAVDCLRFEEGQLRRSDAQFVYDWINRAQFSTSDGVAMNYCEAVEGGFHSRRGLWKLDLRDTLEGREQTVEARWIINAAGVWADRINTTFRIDSPWQHLLAKGASLTFARPEGHRDTLVFDDDGAREGMSLVPWGRVSLWGSTETIVPSPDAGWMADRDDVAFLLDSLNQHLATPLERDDIIALRCGVRPLVVPRGNAGGNPLALSKRWRVLRDSHRPWISIYGGKLTACQSVARYTADLLRDDLGPPVPIDPDRNTPRVEPEFERFAGLEVPSPTWCREHQRCWTLEDYLRRRTNIAQWLPRGGLGKQDMNRPRLREIAQIFALGEERSADELLQSYEDRIGRDFDSVLGIPSTKGDFQ